MPERCLGKVHECRLTSGNEGWGPQLDLIEFGDIVLENALNRDSPCGRDGPSKFGRICMAGSVNQRQQTGMTRTSLGRVR